MSRAAVLIVQDGCVALIERRHAGERYYLFPGGTVESDETAREAAAREAHEELGLLVEVGRLVAEVSYQGTAQYYFLAEVRGGDFSTGQGAELRGGAPPENGTYAPIWLPLDGLPRRPVYPRSVAEIVTRAAGGAWPAETLRIVDPGR